MTLSLLDLTFSLISRYEKENNTYMNTAYIMTTITSPMRDKAHPMYVMIDRDFSCSLGF